MTNKESRSDFKSAAIHVANPFPASAVARLSALDVEGISIPTPALEQAISYADDYVSRIRTDPGGVGPRADEGNVIAIVGEYGTGKTHIALQVLRRISNASEASIHAMYLDAPSDTFLALYRDRFFSKLSKAELRNQILSYYSDLVAEQLSDSDLTVKVADALKAREVSPEDVVQHLGLMGSDLLQLLNARLRTITEIDHFGTALTLFLRPEFEAAVWDWLSCNSPDPVLIERGIQKPIDTDVEALEAMGVFALLYGRQGHRFVLIIDELEKVLSEASSQSPDESTVLAFKKLLEVFGKTRAFLVLIGLPDFLEALPDDAKQRIACLVRPTALTATDTTRYIEETQERASGIRGLKPFSRDVIAYLVELAGGNARRILRLCYHSFQLASMSNTEVTRAVVREAAREQFELTTNEDVRAEIVRVFDGNGWLFEADHSFGERKDSPRSEYWLPVGDQGSGCAIVIRRSLLQQDAAHRVAQLGRQISQAPDGRRLTLLIINGYLASSVSHTVNSAYTRVLTYASRRFTEDLQAAITGVRQRLEAEEDENLLLLMRDRLDEISRQNIRMRTSLDNVLATATSSLLVERAAEKGVRKAFSLMSGAPRGSSDARFPRVARVFDELQNEMVLARRPIDSFIDVMSEQLQARNSNDLDSFSFENSILQISRAFGLFHLAEEAANAFQEGVNSVLEAKQNGRLEVDSFEKVAEMCRGFDRFSRIVGRTLSGEEIPSPNLFTSVGEIDVSAFRQKLTELGRHVYEATRAEMDDIRRWNR